MESWRRARTCRTAGSTGRRSRRSSAPAAARGPARSRRTTRTRPRWGSKRPGSRSRQRRRRTTPDALWFSTVAPAYVDKTNATAIHAALRLDDDVPALDLGGAQRSAVGMLRIALAGSDTVARRSRPTCAPACPGGPRRGRGRRRRLPALLIGDGSDGRCAEHRIDRARRLTEEFVDRWRSPGDLRSKVWEERFGETRYVALGEQAWQAALKDAELGADQVDRAHRHGPARSRRAAGALEPSGRGDEAVVDDLGARLSATPAPPIPRCCSTRRARGRHTGPGHRAGRAGRRRRRLAVPHDGRDRRRTNRRGPLDDADRRRARPCRTASSSPWRGMLPVEPPRRPEPARVSVIGCRPQRGLEVRLRRSGAIRRPARRSCRRCRAAPSPVPMADVARHHRHLHGRSARLLGEPADRLRRRRLRRRRAGCRSSSPTWPSRRSPSVGGSR